MKKQFANIMTKNAKDENNEHINEINKMNSEIENNHIKPNKK